MVTLVYSSGNVICLAQCIYKQHDCSSSWFKHWSNSCEVSTHGAPVSPSPRLSQTLRSLALLRLNLKDNSNPLSITVCFMKILPYSKIYLLQTGCLHIVIRVARSYYNARLRVVWLWFVLFTYFLKGCSLHETNFMWILDINLLHTAPHHTAPNYITHHTTTHHTTPHHTTPHHTIPHHTTLHHTTPYYTKLHHTPHHTWVHGFKPFPVPSRIYIVSNPPEHLFNISIRFWWVHIGRNRPMRLTGQ